MALDQTVLSELADALKSTEPLTWFVKPSGSSTKN